MRPLPPPGDPPQTTPPPGNPEPGFTGFAIAWDTLSNFIGQGIPSWDENVNYVAAVAKGVG